MNKMFALRGIRLIEGEEGANPVTDSGQESGGEQPSGGNPAWDEIRSQLDPISFSKIEPKLKEWDTGVEQRLNSTTEKFKWADEISKAGYQPEQVTQALQVAQMLNEQPEYIYQQLQTFLEQNGRLPQTPQELDEAANDNENELPDDPRFQQLAQQQEKMQEFLVMQENQRMQAQADAELGAEINQLRAKHPEFDEADMQEILTRAAFQAQMAQANGGPGMTLEQAAEDYVNNVRNRILSAKRPGDSAPRLMPTNGGVPASGVAKGTMGGLSKQQTEDLLTELIKQDHQRG